jgi:hypothetical protein
MEGDTTILPGERELVVIARPEARLRAATLGAASFATDTLAHPAMEVDAASPLADVLAAQGATLRPLFGLREERLRAMTAFVADAAETPMPDLSLYYKVQAPDERLDELAEQLREQDAVLTAYVKPAAEVSRLNDMAPSPGEPPAQTPDFSPGQLYLNAAPGGIDARYAWTRPGGAGANVRIIDVEGAWRFTHEDLLQNQGGVVGGTPSGDLGWRNHGTAVVGVIGGDRNAFGVTGICPDANVRAISIFGNLGSAAAIRAAADMLRPGDIILIELHRPGPRLNFQPDPGQRGYIAVEWWADDFDAIRYATGRGVIVVEAAGNGAENLDDPMYDVNPAAPHGPFPPWWKNPFRRSPLDSGAVLVGAGAPPPGTHGNNHGPDRSRLSFSNYGASVDAQGWGREVTTCGYGDLQGGAQEDLWYTSRFSGTSSASPVVVGALGCIQGALRARGAAPLDPAGARALLRRTGSPQQDFPATGVEPARPASQRVGNRPNLRQAIPAALGEGHGDPGAGTMKHTETEGSGQGAEGVQITHRRCGGGGITININVNCGGTAAPAPPRGRGRPPELVVPLALELPEACPLTEDEVNQLVVDVIQSFHPDLFVTLDMVFSDVGIDPIMRRNYEPRVRSRMSVRHCGMKQTFTATKVAACPTVAAVAKLTFDNRI